MSKDIERIELELPIPITVNSAFDWMKKRRKSNKYIQWLEDANNYLIKNGYWTHDNPNGERFTITWDKWLKVTYIYYMPIYTSKWEKKIIDAFNFEKVLSDYLSSTKKWVEWIVKWFEDHKIQSWTVIKINSKRKVVKVIVEELDEEILEYNE